MVSINNKISTLSTIPENVLNKLTDKQIMCIADEFYNMKNGDKDIVEIDVGIGTLVLKYDGDISYKFIPSAKLEKELKSVCTNNTNPLTKNFEKVFIERLTHVYKDLF